MYVRTCHNICTTSQMPHCFLFICWCMKLLYKTSLTANYEEMSKQYTLISIHVWCTNIKCSFLGCMFVRTRHNICATLPTKHCSLCVRELQELVAKNHFTQKMLTHYAINFIQVGSNINVMLYNQCFRVVCMFGCVMTSAQPHQLHVLS